MNRPTLLLQRMIGECLSKRSLPSKKDVQVIARRIEHEGESFITLALPNLAHALECGLETGCLRPVAGFKASKMGMPLLLGGLFKLVFNDDCSLRMDADPLAIRDLRAILLLNKKPKALCSQQRIDKALRDFVTTERDLAAHTHVCALGHDPFLDKISHLLWYDMFKDVSPDCFISSHGPGATAERKSAHSRLKLSNWPYRALMSFPLSLHGAFSPSYQSETYDISLLDEDAEPPVRVVLVPKTMKSPRVIAIEPSHMQYMQQGVKDFLYTRLQSHVLTRDSIRFSDQGANQEHARLASINKELCTMDLSEASDRVHNELVCRIFQDSALLPYLQDCRTRTAKLPNTAELVQLHKFASMGSALCFPVEAMVFYTLIQYSLHKHYGVNPSNRSIIQMSQMIDVYGDDLLFPTGARSIVTNTLVKYGLKVNTTKTFSEGNFRESCGGDYWNGFRVTPVYIRNSVPEVSDPFDVSIYESLVSTSNQLYCAGYERTSDLLNSMIDEWAGFRTTVSCRLDRGGSAFYRLNAYPPTKWCNKLQVPMELRVVSSPELERDPIPDGSAKLLAWKFQKGFASVDQINSVNRGVFKTLRRWVRV